MRTERGTCVRGPWRRREVWDRKPRDLARLRHGALLTLLSCVPLLPFNIARADVGDGQHAQWRDTGTAEGASESRGGAGEGPEAEPSEAVPVTAEQDDPLLVEARQWSTRRPGRPNWIRQPELVDPEGWVVALQAGFVMAVTNDLFGAQQATGGPAPGLSMGAGARGQLGYRSGALGAEIDVAYHYLRTATPDASMYPEVLEAHAIFLGGNGRLWLYPGGRVAVSLSLGGGLSTWFMPWNATQARGVERIEGVWTPYGVLGARLHVSHFFVDLDARLVFGNGVAGSSPLFDELTAVVGLGLGFVLGG